MRWAVVIVVALAGLAACQSSAGFSEEAERGEVLATNLGCVTCHGPSDGVGPTWSGTWGTVRKLDDGSTVVFDAAYVRTSVLEPGRQAVEGYDPVMPPFSLSEADLEALIAYLEAPA